MKKEEILKETLYQLKKEKLSLIEQFIFDKYWNNKEYFLEVDHNGSLSAKHIKNKEEPNDKDRV